MIHLKKTLLLAGGFCLAAVPATAQNGEQATRSGEDMMRVTGGVADAERLYRLTGG